MNKKRLSKIMDLESGISQSIVARLINGTRELKNISFETASKLNECAERLIKYEVNQ